MLDQLRGMATCKSPVFFYLLPWCGILVFLKRNSNVSRALSINISKLPLQIYYLMSEQLILSDNPQFLPQFVLKSPTKRANFNKTKIYMRRKPLISSSRIPQNPHLKRKSMEILLTNSLSVLKAKHAAKRFFKWIAIFFQTVKKSCGKKIVGIIETWFGFNQKEAL